MFASGSTTYFSDCVTSSNSASVIIAGQVSCAFNSSYEHTSSTSGLGPSLRLSRGGHLEAPDVDLAYGSFVAEPSSMLVGHLTLRSNTSFEITQGTTSDAWLFLHQGDLSLEKGSSWNVLAPISLSASMVKVTGHVKLACDFIISFQPNDIIPADYELVLLESDGDVDLAMGSVNITAASLVSSTPPQLYLSADSRRVVLGYIVPEPGPAPGPTRKNLVIYLIVGGVGLVLIAVLVGGLAYKHKRRHYSTIQ
eukprot:TRINITY_DN21156_c0_g1_i1.p1 TRINITY_DN21156_c0_g1~~TRINITY_DN21156_c0_g1_i1.p1  ORF type:complete len:261 (+),score=57.43 TRINITY_DN21156_c0_g1_i1:29-784(+)